MHEVKMFVDYTGNGLKYAIWKDDGEFSEMGLKMPSKVTVDRSIRMNMHLFLSEWNVGKIPGQAASKNVLESNLVRLLQNEPVLDYT